MAVKSLLHIFFKPEKELDSSGFPMANISLAANEIVSIRSLRIKPTSKIDVIGLTSS
jgi:hypothetical protein